SARYRRLEEPAVMDALRRVFRRMNRSMVLMWRLGFRRIAGVWPGGFGRLMVIEHTGRSTGSSYRTPVNYTVDSGDLYCVAAFGQRTDWYRNVLADRTVAVWLPDGRWEASAEEASDDPRRLDLVRGVLIDSGFAAPLFGLSPRTMNDEQLAGATEGYRLVRFHPDRKQPSADGPDDLVWMWLPVAGAVLAGCLAARRRRQG
ncbi:MAG: nitroreductase family deazaflavin-dependent oxidoreductase, partial [Acidimicrobiia bacterium]|nr:nitroreductase family deazaflavin-dependent oxidoreductase [Acidimicrobiia bacterium]